MIIYFSDIKYTHRDVMYHVFDCDPYLAMNLRELLMMKIPLLPSIKRERNSTKYYLKKIKERAHWTYYDIDHFRYMFKSGIYWKVEDYAVPALLLTKYLRLAFTYRWLRCSGIPYCEYFPNEGRYCIDISYSPYIGDTVYACVNMGIKGEWLEFSFNNQTLISFNERRDTLTLEGVEIPSGLEKLSMFEISELRNDPDLKRWNDIVNPIYNLYYDPIKDLLWKLHDYAQDFTQTYHGEPRDPS